MRKFILLSLLLSGIHLNAQSFQDFVNSLFATSAPLRQARVDSFMTANSQFPLVENDSAANFILTGNFNTVQVAGDMNGWNPSTPGFTLMNIPATNFFFLTKYFEKNARLDYKFVTNGSNWILDPNNPNQVSGGFGPNSELAMPGYIRPWEILSYPNVPQGALTFKTVSSSIMSKSFEVQIYLPPNYDSSKTYPVAYFHDGHEYLLLGNAKNVMDNLIDSNLISPLIGVFVKPNDRNEEYGFSQRYLYRDFFCDELVPYIDNNYSTKPDSLNRATIGASFGGNISALIVMGRPEVFYKTGQHSGAWWPNNYEALGLFMNSHKDMPMPSVWGTYEGGLTAMWDSLPGKNYPNKYYRSYPEGHSWGLWRATLDELLIHLFPGSAVIGLPEEPQTLKSLRIYPNPVQNSTLIIDNQRFEGEKYTIMATSGKVCQTGEVGESRAISLADLKAGYYYLIIGGYSAVLIKQD